VLTEGDTSGSYEAKREFRPDVEDVEEDFHFTAGEKAMIQVTRRPPLLPHGLLDDEEGAVRVGNLLLPPRGGDILVSLDTHFRKIQTFKFGLGRHTHGDDESVCDLEKQVH
jgi:hypothetical protein